MTLNCYLDDFYFPIKPHLSPRTIGLYRYTVRKFGEYLGRPPMLSDLTNVEVGKYLMALADSGLKPGTVDKERRQLLAIWRDARLAGELDRGPRIQPVKVPDPIPRAFSTAEIVQLTLAFDKLQGKTGGIPNRDIVRACAGIQYYTGERIGAVAQLRPMDVRGGVIVFRASTRKGGRRNSIKGIPPVLQQQLSPFVNSGRDVLFPDLHGTTKIFVMYRRLYKRAGVHVEKGKCTHVFRSTYATKIKGAGGNATEACGHASKQITDRHYIDGRELIDNTWQLLPEVDFLG